MAARTLSYEIEDTVGILTLDRPPVNATRYTDLAELGDRFSTLPEDGELAVVFRTASEVFMAGHDIEEFEDYDVGAAGEHKATYLSFMRAVRQCAIPTIAAIDGPALGAGAILVALCDVRVAGPDATIGLAEIDAGIIGGYGPLRRLLPEGVARRMAYTGESIDADRAHELGLVSDRASDPVAAARRIAETIASKNPDAVRTMKRSMVGSQSDQPIEDYARERDYIIELRKRPNAEEAARAFLEGREPEFEDDGWVPELD